MTTDQRLEEIAERIPHWERADRIMDQHHGPAAACAYLLSEVNNLQQKLSTVRENEKETISTGRVPIPPSAESKSAEQDTEAAKAAQEKISDMENGREKDLREENQRLGRELEESQVRSAAHSANHSQALVVNSALKEDLRKAVEGLNEIARWEEGVFVTGRFDEPASAQKARDTLKSLRTQD